MRWQVVAIVMLGAILRLSQLDGVPPGLYSAEAINGSTALEVIRTGDYRVYYREDNGREGLFVALQTVVLRLIPVEEPWVLRLAPAVIGILTVPGLYLLGRELFSRQVGIFAAFFLATSFWHLVFSRIAFRAILAPLLSVWAIYWLLVALRPGPRVTRSLATAIFAGAIFGLGFYTYIAYRVSPLLLLAFVPLFLAHRGTALAFLASAFTVAAPIGWYFLQHPEEFSRRASQVSLLSSGNPVAGFFENVMLTLGMLLVRGDGNPRHNLPWHPELFAPVAVLFMIGVIVILGRLRTRRSGTARSPREELAPWLMLTWLTAGFLPAVLSNEGMPHAMRSIFMIPAVMLLAGLGASKGWDALQRRSPRRATAVATGIAVLIVVHVSVTYFVIWGRDARVADGFAAQDLATARAIAAMPPEVPKYVVVEPPDRDVNDLPFAAYPVMFVTGTYTEAGRRAKRVTYLRPEEAGQIPPGAATFYVVGR